jgi:hypothetical protein
MPATTATRPCVPAYCFLYAWKSADGDISVLPQTGRYLCGTTISLYVIDVTPGWQFDGWTGDVNSSDPHIIVTLIGDKSVWANFSRIPPPPADGGGCEGRILNIADDCSPIVFNFESGDYRLTGRNSPVLFDMRGNGHPQLMGWTAAGADEAFLWLDRNHNGKVTSGAELFGNFTPLKNRRMAINGFEALAEFDANHDGVIDDLDPIWPQLMLWRDLNHNGISEPNEMSRLDNSDVTAIDLHDHWTGKHDRWGNTFRYKSLVSIRNKSGYGEQKQPVYDIFFVSVSP